MRVFSEGSEGIDLWVSIVQGFQRQYHIIYIWEFPKNGGVPYLGTLIIRILILFIGVLY